MRKLFVWTLGLAAALQVLLMANAVHQYVRFSLSSYENGESVYAIDPIEAIELNMTTTTIEVLSWTTIGLIAGAILVGFLLKARAALIGVAAASFGVGLFFAGLLPYHHDDALIPLGVTAVVVAGVSALLEWRGIAFYKKAPDTVPERHSARDEEAAR